MSKKCKIYNILSFIIILLLITAETFIGLQIYHLDMLPDKYFVLVIVAFVLVDLIIALLIFWKADDQQNKKHIVSRVLGYFLSIFVISGLLILGQAISKVQETVSSVTQEAEVRAVVDVYVLEDDPAETIEDASGYSFAVTESFDWDNTEAALEALKEQHEMEVSTVTYPTVFAMVDALYAGEVDGLFLNSAYVDILEEMEPYADFTERVKTIWSYNVREIVSVEEKKPVQEEKILSEESNDDSFVVYLSGSDTRSKVLKTSRSDVNILAVVNTKTHQILLVNTPRDY